MVHGNFKMITLELKICFSETPEFNGQCFRDSGDENRILGEANERNKLNTIQNCISFCFLYDFSYAGVGNEDQCFCGKNPPTQDPISDSECNSKCPGDQTKICGGDLAINVYSVPAASTSGNLFLDFPFSKRYTSLLKYGNGMCNGIFEIPDF